MEIDVGYAGIYIGYVYYSIQKYNSILKDLLCGSEVREELWRLCDGRDSV